MFTEKGTISADALRSMTSEPSAYESIVDKETIDELHSIKQILDESLERVEEEMDLDVEKYLVNSHYREEVKMYKE